MSDCHPMNGSVRLQTHIGSVRTLQVTHPEAPRGTAIPIITNYRKLSQTIAPVCGSSGFPGALRAAPSRGNVSWGCSDTFAAVVRRAGASWCCPLSHWHAMHGTPHRRQNVIRTSRASEVSMAALPRVGQPRGCSRMAKAGGEGGPPPGPAIRCSAAVAHRQAILMPQASTPVL